MNSIEVSIRGFWIDDNSAYMAGERESESDNS